MHRPTVGLIALVCLAAAAWLWWFPLTWQGSAALQGATTRIGLVMGAIWLALPQLSRIPGWILQLVAATALIVAVRPKFAIVAIPVLLAYLILRPKKLRPKKRP